MSAAENVATVVTGVTSGIGRKLLILLAKNGSPVIALARPGERSRRVIDEVRAGSGNSLISLVEADLASLREVRAAAARVAELAGESGVGRLILNAAMVTAGTEWTAEGFEKMFAVNHLGAAALTLALEEPLKRCKSSQVCVVSSDAHRWVAGVSVGEMLERDPARRLSALKTYGATKLVGLVFFNELAKRWSQVCVTAHHPGFVSTNLGLHGSWGVRLWWRLSRWRMRAPEVAAAELLSVAGKAPRADGCLRYWEQAVPHQLPPACEDAGLAEEVWQISCAPETFLETPQDERSVEVD